MHYTSNRTFDECLFSIYSAAFTYFKETCDLNAFYAGCYLAAMEYQRHREDAARKAVFDFELAIS